MADRLDVAERLAEGGLAVEHTQSYVRACHALGFQEPDLTSHPAQVCDWYDGEDGLDLRALDRDCAELRAAGLVVLDALRMQRAQVAELAGAWTGPGADSAVRLLERHCDTANTLATELRAAAQRCESLRDNLWYLVDSKVASAITVDDRTQPQRQAWLAAAAVITTGAGDRPNAEQVLRQQVMPYVDTDIRNDWLTTMRSTRDGVATAYDMVIDRMAATPSASFECPGDLGPGYPAVQPTPPSTLTPPAAVTPAAFGPPADPAPAPPLTPVPPVPLVPPASAATTATTPPDWGTALGDASGMPVGDLGGGQGGGGGLAGLANRIVEAIGGLIGSATDQLGAADASDADPFAGDPFPVDDERDADPDEPEKAEDVDDTEEAPPDEEAQADEKPLPVSGPPAPIAAPAPDAIPATAPEPVDAAEPPPAPGVPAPPAKEGSTPCEIAADQLPQAGQ